VDQKEYMSQVLGRSKYGCAWISQHPKFRTWLESNKSKLLWITAKAGCGKTTLAAHISELVSSKQHSVGSSSFGSEMKPVVLTFFFQRSSQEAGQTSLVALKTFAAQLAGHQPATLPVLLQRYKRLSAEGGFTWSWANMSSVFSDMLGCLPSGAQVFVILDAIDECETASATSIIEWIDKIVHTSDRGEARIQIRVLATSRPDGMLLDTLHDVPTLVIEESDTANDIEMFIDAQVEQFAHQRHLRREISQSIAHFLKNNAQGMFLWVVLIMKELERRDARLTDAVIAQRLSTIPLTLVETYTRIIQAPPLPRREDMWRIIRWLLYGCRALTLDELEIGLCLEDGTLNWHGFAGDLEFVCGSLIRIDGPGKQVGFIHQTARSFLESYIQGSSVQDVAGLQLDARSSHEQLALACLDCLSRSEKMAPLNHALLTMAYQREYVDAIEMFFHQHPFFRYATEGWAHHIRAAGPASHRLESSLYEFLSSPICRTNVLRLTFFIFKQGSASVPEVHEPLHLAAYFNLPQLVSRYISEGHNPIDSVSESNDTPLVWASEMGSAECVKLLLEAGADPNAFEYDGWSALHWAARNGHADVAELLLGKGAKADQRDSKGNTPLDWAVDREHWGVIGVFQRRGLASQTRIEQGMGPEHSDLSKQSVTSHARKSVWKLWDYRP
jgi:energy-coupling factor transporter ATP-binding protein EcfA2